MEKFAALLSKEWVAYLTAYLTGYREFLCKQWFKYLSFNWGFSIRIYHTDLIVDGSWYLPLRVIFSNLAVGEVRIFLGNIFFNIPSKIADFHNVLKCFVLYLCLFFQFLSLKSLKILNFNHWEIKKLISFSGFFARRWGYSCHNCSLTQTTLPKTKLFPKA